MIKWDGFLPVRRYAIFNDVIRGNYLTSPTPEGVGFPIHRIEPIMQMPE